MVGAQGVAVGGTGVATGVGSTLLVRRELDQTGETTVLRPSVLWGVVTGLAGMGGAMWMRGQPGRPGIGAELLEDYGEAALTAGLFSAFSPKGGGVGLPTV